MSAKPEAHTGQVFRLGAKRLAVTTKRPKIPRPGIMAAPPTHGLTPLSKPTGGNNKTSPSTSPRTTLDEARVAKLGDHRRAQGVARSTLTPAQTKTPMLDHPVARPKNTEAPSRRPTLAAP
jgi:hypothetical protein